MKTATTILLALCFSSLILAGFAAEVQDESSNTLTVTATDSDTGSSTSIFPLNIVNNAGVKQTAISASAGTSQVNGATTYAGNTYTYTYTSGLPQVSTYALSAQTTASTPADYANGYIIIKLSIGNKVVTVSGMISGGSATGTMQSSATATFVQGTNKCGDSFWDAINGYVTFYLTDACTVTVSQINAVTGVLQYDVTSLSSDQVTALTTALAKVANGVSGVSGATANVNAQATGSTLAYYSVQGPSGTPFTSTLAGNVQSSVASAIAAKSIAVTGANQLNGYAQAIAPGTAATNAPSADAKTGLAANAPKNHSRMVAIVGVSTTVAAAFFGLAL